MATQGCGDGRTWRWKVPVMIGCGNAAMIGCGNVAMIGGWGFSNDRAAMVGLC